MRTRREERPSRKLTLRLLLPELLVALAMTFWVIVEAFGAVAMRHIPIPQLVWLRYVIHVTLMLLLCAPTSGLRFLRSRQLPLQFGRSFTMVVMPVSFALAIQRMSGGEVMAWFWTAPLMVLAVARWQYGLLRPVVVALALLAWCGAWVVYRPGFAFDPAAISFSLLMAGSFAAYIVLTPVLDRTDGVLTNLFYSAAGVVLVLTPVIPFVWRTPSVRVWIATLAVSILGWVTLWLLDLALRRGTLDRIATMLFIQVPVSLVLGAVVRRRFGDVDTWIAGALVALAVALAAWTTLTQRLKDAALLEQSEDPRDAFVDRERVRIEP